MHQSSVPSDITPLYFSQLKHYILWSKEPIKEQFFLDFQVIKSKFVKFLMSVLKWQVNSSSNFALFFIVVTHNSSANFKVIPFQLWQKDPIKIPILTLSIALVKICQISQVFFSNPESVFLQNLYISLVSLKITPLYFCSSNSIYFGHKEPIKTQIF